MYTYEDIDPEVIILHNLNLKSNATYAIDFNLDLRFYKNNLEIILSNLRFFNCSTHGSLL